MHYSSKHGVEAYRPSGRSVKSHQLLYCPVCTRHSNAQFTLPIIMGVNHRGSVGRQSARIWSRGTLYQQTIRCMLESKSAALHGGISFC